MKSENIVERIKKGDERIFEFVYKEYYTRLYWYVFGYVKNDDDTKEILQNTFISLWNKRCELAEDTKIYAWLFSVVKNQCLNQLRDKANRLNLLNTVEQFENERIKWQTISLQSFIPEEITLSELQHLIDVAVKAMPEQCKQIFILSRYENLSHNEISEKLNISTKTIENQITKALRIIKEKLNRDYYIFFLILIYSRSLM